MFNNNNNNNISSDFSGSEYTENNARQAPHFLKPFLKGNILRSGEWERGKFDFDHFFAFLTNFLKRWNFLLSGIWFSFICPKRTFPSNFVKLVSKILCLFLAEKWSFVVLFCCFVVCCNFVRFWLTSFFNWSICRAEKDAFKEKIIPCTVWELLNP